LGRKGMVLSLKSRGLKVILLKPRAVT